MLIIESWLKKHGKEQHRSWEERFNRHQGGLSYFPDSTGLVIAKIAILIGFYTFISESRSRHFFSHTAMTRSFAKTTKIIQKPSDFESFL